MNRFIKEIKKSYGKDVAVILENRLTLKDIEQIEKQFVLPFERKRFFNNAMAYNVFVENHTFGKFFKILLLEAGREAVDSHDFSFKNRSQSFCISLKTFSDTIDFVIDFDGITCFGSVDIDYVKNYRYNRFDNKFIPLNFRANNES